jgi:hypothetical protein
MAKEVTVIDFGSHVLCDFCNEEHSADKTAIGGVLHGTYALCPKCVEYSDLKPSQIRARAAAMETFHAFVMRIRDGNNTMTITSHT